MNTSTRVISAFASLICVSFATAMEVIVYTNDASCGLSNGWASAYVDSSDGIGGSLPYTYFWDPAPPVGQGTEEVSGLAPGEYSITVTDAFGIAASAIFTINALPGLLLDPVAVDTIFSCFGSCLGQGWIWGGGPIGGTPPYTVSFDPTGPSGQVQNTWNYGSVSVSGLCEGESYQITVSDSQGCSSMIPVLNTILVEPLQLLASNVTASCPDGATGGLELWFDRPVHVLTSQGGDSAEFNSYQNLGELEPGPITVYVFGGYSACQDTATYTFTIPSSSNNCGTISGTLFLDPNGDCVQDPGEFGLPNRTLQFSTQDFAITDANGNYSRDLALGEHDLNFNMPNYSPICPASFPLTFELSAADPIIQQDIAMEFNGGGPDLFIVLNTSQVKPGYSSWTSVSVVNNSPYTFTGLELQLEHSALQTLDPNDTSSVATVIGPGQLSWTIPTIAPISTQQFSQGLLLPPDPNLIGTQINYSAQLIQPTPDNDPSNDIATAQITVVGAFDPNDKLASFEPSLDWFPELYVLSDHHPIDYTIRFQNTGNAEAEHVFIIDTISDLFDASSLEILGASHTYEVEWHYDRVLRFDLPQIMLPDSASDPLNSQGFVSFRLSPIEDSLSHGSVLLNSADIYFDFNPPIRTNTTIVEVFDAPFSIDENAAAMIGSFPNPTTDQITIEADIGQLTWTITATDGKIVLAGRNTAQERSIDVSSLAKGQYVLQVIGNDRTGYAKFIKQ